MNTPDRGLYTPPADAPLSFDARDTVPVKKGPLLLGITAVLIVTFVGVVWTTFKSGVRERGGPPHIAAAESPFKAVPEDTGGAVIPDQDKTVYDTVSGDATDAVQSFAPTAEQPVDRAKLATIDPIDDAPVAKTPVSDKPASDKPMPALRGEADAPPLPPAPAELTEKPAAAPVKPATKPASGGVAVQIAAARSMEQAEGFWRTASAKFPDITGYSKDIQVADLGEKGTFYRVRATGFASRDAASAFCTKMKAAGQDCMVK